MLLLFENDLKTINTLGRARMNCLEVFQYLQKMPRVSVPLLAKELNISAPTARASVNHLISLGIIEEVTGKQRDKEYVYKQYLNLLELGAEPL